MDGEFNGLQNRFLMPGAGNLQTLLSLAGKIVRELQWLQAQLHTNHHLDCPQSEISLQFLLFLSYKCTEHTEGKKSLCWLSLFCFCLVFADICSLIPYIVKETPNEFPNTVCRAFETYIYKNNDLWFDTSRLI